MISRQWIKSFSGGIRTNTTGCAVNKKLLIIESDDWGAIRTPSSEALIHFKQAGFEIDRSLYKVDALASESDLNDLFDLLLSHKNIHGNNPVITANAIMANPDFKKIREQDFRNFYHEPFYETFKSYPQHMNNLQLWKKGESLGIFIPEYHGREHLNVSRWISALQSGDTKTRFAYEWHSTYSGNDDYAYMEAYDWNDSSEVSSHKRIMMEGATIFEDTFGRKPRSFIAPCYNWDPELEKTISELGIKWIQGIRSQLAPTGSFNEYKRINHYFGEANGYGSRYNIRNVFFEPSSNPALDWTDRAMARIQAAFLLNKPAVLSSHRINYVGYIDPMNKANGLFHLNKLLKTIINKWPEVTFISTAELSRYVK